MASDAPRRSALVTGASSGIGEAFAERLAADGYAVTLVARRRERLEELAGRLRDRHGARADVLAADLTEPDALRAVEERLAADEALALLVNNAGFGGYMRFVELEPERAEELIRLHVLAATRLARAALPGMLARRSGAVINVASLLAFSAAAPAPPLPFRAVYAACKSYLVTFSQILANELRDSGVQAQVLCPGLVRTEFHEVMGRDTSDFPPVIMSPQDVVQASLAALQLGEAVCIPGLPDPSLVGQVLQAQARLLEHSRTPNVADRYR
jgi:short-subunit dehydrogenase